MTAVAIQHREEIISQVAKGTMLKAIAAKVGVSPQAIANQLAKDPDYRQAREIGAEVRLEEQFDGILEAEGTTDVSRAREGFRAAAWFAEREFPERWGAKANVVTVQVNVAGADQLLAGSAVAMLAEIVPTTEPMPQCVKAEDARA